MQVRTTDPTSHSQLRNIGPGRSNSRPVHGPSRLRRTSLTATGHHHAPLRATRSALLASARAHRSASDGDDRNSPAPSWNPTRRRRTARVRDPHRRARQLLPCYDMISPRGGRPHDDAPSQPSSKSPPVMGAARVHEWEAGLPTAAELTPLSHQLIPRALGAAFRIDVAGNSSDSPTSHLSFPCDDFDDEDDEDGDRETEAAWPAAPGGNGKAGKKKKKKKQRMVWTAELHRRFIDAVTQLGDKAAVPKAIVQVMNVEGITREHVASHLQKYRVYLKRARTTHAATHGFPFISPQPSSDTSNRRD